ncbi:DUF5681 domain-containing protein [Nordella sp. HKS 07]|uniref:DUF5681 domain-containing protein n=1 Tax=Nordella sp. HKS 07 TaxID=2712222 RepID=UPI00352E05AA
MIADAIKEVSGRNGMVLDLSGSSGSPLIAAPKTGKRAYLCEYAPLYCDRIIWRWEPYAKNVAVQLACGLGEGIMSSRPQNDHRTRQARNALAIRPAAYDVGHARSLAQHRFRKGQSGNPRGRPKGAKNKLPAPGEERLKQILLEETYRPD